MFEVPVGSGLLTDPLDEVRDHLRLLVPEYSPSTTPARVPASTAPYPDDF